MQNKKNKPAKNENSYIVYLKQVHDKKYYSCDQNNIKKQDEDNKPAQKESKKGLFI